MRRIIISLVVIAGAAAALAVGSTGAFFSDSEVSTGNTFAAGAIDLKIDNESYYNNVLSTTTSWALNDLTIQKFFDFADLKPGDRGEDTISLHVSTNDAYLCANVKLTSNDDNGFTEPEALVDSTAGVGNGELASLTNFVWWADDGDNVFEDNEHIISQGPIGALGLNGSTTITLADSQTNIWTGQGGPVPGNQTYYIGKAWCFGTIGTLPLAQDGLGTTSPRTPANSTGGITCDGSLLGNESQTDSLTANVSFTAIQSRHNGSFLCVPPVVRPTAKLTVIKVVKNDNGGNNVVPDFHLFVDDGSVSTGVVSGATAAIENVIQFQIGSNLVSEIYISNIQGTFVTGEKINVTLDNGDIKQETLFSLLGGITVTNPGLRYRVEDVVHVVGGSGENATASVESIFGEDTGRVQSSTNTVVVSILPPVSNPPSITLPPSASTVNGFYDGMPITIQDGPGAGQTKTIISYNSGTNVCIVDSDWEILPTIQSHYSIALGKIRTVKVKDFGINYITPTLDFSGAGNGAATGTPVISSLGIYPGRWINTDGFLDSDKKIEDSFFYQDFSYVLKVSKSLNVYQGIVKKLLHPAGTILFGEVDINVEYMLGPTYKTLERHKFRFQPYEGFLQTFPSPNADYWTSDGPANTAWSIYLNTVNGEVTLFPNTKRNHLPDPYITVSNLIDSVGGDGLECVYDCVEGLDPQVLYDVEGLHNGILGSSNSVDNSDPVYTSEGLQFATLGQFCTCNTVPVNPLTQTILVVAKTINLSQKQSLLGCIDVARDDSVTGYSIDVNIDGSIDYRAQKNNSSTNLVASFPAGTIVPEVWFVATLRYSGNTVTADLNNGTRIQNNFLTNVDGGPITNDSFGYILANQGFTPPINNNSLFGAALFGRTFWNGSNAGQVVILHQEDSLFDGFTFGEEYFGGLVQETVVIPPDIGSGNIFTGDIAYAIIWDRAITDSELLQTYLFLKNSLISRGIVLP